MSMPLASGPKSPTKKRMVPTPEGESVATWSLIVGLLTSNVTSNDEPACRFGWMRFIFCPYTTTTCGEPVVMFSKCAIPSLSVYGLIRNRIDVLCSEGVVTAQKMIASFRPGVKKD